MTATMTEALLIPTVHMNGTSRDELEKQLRDASDAIRKAMAVLHKACPNDRDYYVRSQDAGLAARAQHRSRMQRLESVRQELEAIFMAMQNNRNLDQLVSQITPENRHDETDRGPPVGREIL